MAVPWSCTAEAFLLHQMGTVSQFWKQGRQAKIHFEVKDGEGFLNLSYRLPGAAEPLPSHPQANHPKFPNGQVPRPTKPINPLFPGNQDKPKHRSPSYYRRNHRRAILYRAEKAVPHLPPPLPNSLRELATRAVGQANKSPEQSTPLPTRKRKLSPSPSSIRKVLQQDFLIDEEVISDTESPKDHLEEISDTRSTEVLRSPEEISDEAGEGRLEASLEVENRQEETSKLIDWNEEMEEEEFGGEEIIGKGELYSILGIKEYILGCRRSVRKMVGGTISVTKKSIMIRSETGEILWDKEILGEKYRNEDVKLVGGGWISTVYWKEETGKEYGLKFDWEKKSEFRDKLFKWIEESKKEEDIEDMGFGLFD